jgi:hypothetical protein
MQQKFIFMIVLKCLDFLSKKNKKALKQNLMHAGMKNVSVRENLKDCILQTKFC